MRSFKNNLLINQQDRNHGFSLVELIISVAVIAVLISVVVVSQQDFNESAKLRNTAHEISLLIKEAQTKAINPSQYSSAGDFDPDGNVQIPDTSGNPSTATFEYGYGVFIPADMSQVILFADSPRNTNDANLRYGGYFDDSSQSSDFVVRAVNLPAPFKIEKTCYRYINGSSLNSRCNDGNDFNLHIGFGRPFLQPKINSQSGGCNNGFCQSVQPNEENVQAWIEISESGGTKYYIVVELTGHVYTTNDNPSGSIEIVTEAEVEVMEN